MLTVRQKLCKPFRRTTYPCGMSCMYSGFDHEMKILSLSDLATASVTGPVTEKSVNNSSQRNPPVIHIPLMGAMQNLYQVFSLRFDMDKNLFSTVWTFSLI